MLDDSPPSGGANSPPSAAIVADRLHEVYGPGTRSGSSTLTWWIPGATSDLGVRILFDTSQIPMSDAPCVIWVTRPSESKPERCPIVTMQHLDAFLALVSIARRSPEPVHGHVCPGED